LDLAFSRDSTLLLSGGKDHSARLWHVLGGGALLGTFMPNCGEIRSVALVAFDDNVFCGGEEGWSVWSTAQKGIARLWNGGATIGALSFDASGDFLAVGGENGQVRVWDRNYDLREALDPQLSKEYINGIAFSPDGRWLAAAGQRNVIHVWDRTNNWERLAQESEDGRLTHAGPIWGLCFSPDGQWLASSNSDGENRIRRWDASDDWALIEQSDPAPDHIYALGVDPQGRWIVSGDSAASLVVRDVGQLNEIGSSLTTATEGETNLWSVAVCRDPLCVFTGGNDGHVYRWTPGEKSWSRRTSEEDAQVNHVINSVSYSRRFGWVAAAGDGNSVEIYDRDLRKVLSLPGHDGTIWMVAFDPEGERLAYGGSDRIVRVWDMSEVQRILDSGSVERLYEESQRHTGL
jgi:WD40 repeat protein